MKNTESLAKQNAIVRYIKRWLYAMLVSTLTVLALVVLWAIASWAWNILRNLFMYIALHINETNPQAGETAFYVFIGIFAFATIHAAMGDNDDE